MMVFCWLLFVLVWRLVNLVPGSLVFITSDLRFTSLRGLIIVKMCVVGIVPFLFASEFGTCKVCFSQRMPYQNVGPLPRMDLDP